MIIIIQNDRKSTRSRTHVITLLIVAAIMLAGCKNASENETISETVEDELVQTNNTNEAVEPEVSATGNLVEDEAASVQFSQTAAPVGVPLLSVDTIVRESYWSKEVLHIRYDEVSVSGDGFETVAQAVSEWNKQDIEQIKSMEDLAGYTNELTSDVECIRMDSSVISFKQRWHEEDGFVYYRGINFDVASGKRLILADILADEEGFARKATEIAVKKLLEISDADKLPSGYADDVAYDFTSGVMDEQNKWYLDAHGIVYYYTNFEDTFWHGYIPNHHEDIPDPEENIPETDDESDAIDSDLPGNITVTIPYEDVAEYMKPAYCGIQGAGVAQFAVNEKVLVNLSNKRIAEKVSCEESSGADLSAFDTVLITMVETGSEEDVINKICITVNDREETFETEAWMRDAYLLCQENGSTYLLFDTALADHDYTTYLYDITNGSITKNEELEYTWIIKPVNANSLILLDILNIFGTYFGYTVCTVDESSGKIIYPELHYTNAEFSNTTLTLTRELPVIIYDEETTLPPGTPLQITAVSDSGTAYFYELNDGLAGEFYYTIDNSGTICIEGEEEASYFEFLPYSG